MIEIVSPSLGERVNYFFYLRFIPVEQRLLLLFVFGKVENRDYFNFFLKQYDLEECLR